MIRINKLYSSPNLFESIEFHNGVNLILGEKVKKPKDEKRKNKKTNGVGKSMSVEFINFALLKDENDSRVMKIPLDKIPKDFKVKLDLTINSQKITIERNWHQPDKPIIYTQNEVVSFNNIADALQFLHELTFNSLNDKETEYPSFREMVSLLLRDEDSEFKTILSCHSVDKRIPASNLIATHLYLFNLSLTIVREIKKIYSKLEKEKTTKAHLKVRLTDDGRKKISDVKSELNALERDVEKAEMSLEKFESESLLEHHKLELFSLDEEINDLRVKQSAVRSVLRDIDSIPRMEILDLADIELLYNKFKDGLGSTISKSFNEVIDFKKKIEKYQNELVENKANTLRIQSSGILDRLNELDERRSVLLAQVDSKGVLKDFKNSISVYSQQKDKLSKNIANLEEYDTAERKIKKFDLRKDNLFSELDAQLFERANEIKKFEKTLIEMHEFIMGNAEASFDIETVNKAKSKTIIEPHFRIEDDGSHSVNRTKVFMYDIALMLNVFTKVRHPNFLIHDNIFDVDQDTLVQCLNYLNSVEKNGNDFQYILTLNRDKIESEERRDEIELDIDEHRVARFTREDTFLKFKYKEM